MRLADPWLRRTLARCGSAGADVVHIGVGPSTRAAPWARSSDSARIGARPTGQWCGSVDGPLVGVPHEAGGSVERMRGARRPVEPGPLSPVVWSRTVAAPPRRVPRVPAWAEPVRAGSAQPVRAGAAARVAPPGFDARQFRELARALPEVRFVLGAGCLPTDELARLAALPNVHVMLTEILPWAGSLEFAHAFGTLLAAFGAERLLFGSGYPMMRPGPLVRALATYRFPTEVSRRYPRFDAAAARAVLGGNAARLYRIPVEPAAATPAAAGA